MTHRDGISDAIRQRRIAERNRRRTGFALMLAAAVGAPLVRFTPLREWMLSLDPLEQAYLHGAYVVFAIIFVIGVLLSGIVGRHHRNDSF